MYEHVNLFIDRKENLVVSDGQSFILFGHLIQSVMKFVLGMITVLNNLILQSPVDFYFITIRCYV